jgi:transcription initiation factor TFIIB
MATRDIYGRGFDGESGKTLTETATCPECDGRLASDSGEIACTECGLVVDEQRVDHGPEWHQYDEQERRRTGAPLTEGYHDRGLSTEIGHGGDASGTTLSTRKRRQLGRLRREHSRSRFQSAAERNLAHGLGEIRRIVSTLELSETLREQACALFRSAQNENLLHGRSIEAMAAASVYGACRCTRTSRTVAEVAETARVEQARVNCAYKALNVKLGLPAKPVTLSEFVPRLASELAVSDSVR